MSSVENLWLLAANLSNTTGRSQPTPPPPWVAPPIDAWTTHYWKLMSLFICYIICFTFGQIVNWICLLNINKTNLTSSARYLMTLQCIFNTIYITVNFPYKATILYLQRTFLPIWLKIFCGWLHQWVVFGTIFLQLANRWFKTPRDSMVPVIISNVFGFLYSLPSVHPCCYRFYKFTSYAMSYIGYSKQIQLRFSVTATSMLIFLLITCYTAISVKIRQASRKMTSNQRGQRNDAQKETKLTLLFAVTGCIWIVYLILFYTIYWSNLFTPYSFLALFNEMLEQCLFLLDPVVYMCMSSDLRRCILRSVGVKVAVVAPIPQPNQNLGLGPNDRLFAKRSKHNVSAAVLSKIRCSPAAAGAWSKQSVAMGPVGKPLGKNKTDG